ncbi:MAG TPA: hypothetical protein VFP36_12480, partial [Usitatibacter sp.]|nr:hypothetical protein [Usitatibacter sp.]
LAILATTARSVSPDEFSHVEAARYYLDRWLPAKVGDPATLASYSAYGASYLNEMDVVYLLAAKFTAALAFTGLDDVLRLRLFNVALLALCGLLALRSRVGRIAVLPLLCTPQAWYVFGYFNADALGLVAATLLATAVVTWLDRSAEHPTLLQEAGARWAVALGILLALCLLSKRTFYPFVPFVAAYALWRLGYRTRSTFVLGALGLFTLAAWFYARPPFESVPGLIASGGARAALAALAAFLLIAAGWMTYRDYDPRRRFPKALLVAAAVAIALVVLRVGADMVVNGLPGEKARALSALAERIARPDFRPAVLGTQASYFGMALAGRGVPLGEMLFGQYAWVSTMAASFFGVYGYMSIVAVSALYWTQYAFAAVLLAAIAWACVPDRVSRGVLLLGAVAIVLTLELALGHSWVIDLQPQGRYAFAILPVVSLLLLEAQRRRDAGAAGSALMAAHGAIVALWLLALASFAFIALPNVTRIA